MNFILVGASLESFFYLESSYSDRWLEDNGFDIGPCCKQLEEFYDTGIMQAELAGTVEQAAAASESMSGQAHGLNELMGFFTVERGEVSVGYDG